MHSSPPYCYAVKEGVSCAILDEVSTNLFLMYTIIKCEGCTKMFAVSRKQPYVICPACGCSFRRDACTSYLDCEYRTVAVEIAARLDKLIQGRSTPELTPEEMRILQRDYQKFFEKGVEDHQIGDNHGEETSDAEGKPDVKKIDAFGTDENDEYDLFD